MRAQQTDTRFSRTRVSYVESKPTSSAFHDSLRSNYKGANQEEGIDERRQEYSYRRKLVYYSHYHAISLQPPPGTVLISEQLCISPGKVHELGERLRYNKRASKSRWKLSSETHSQVTHARFHKRYETRREKERNLICKLQVQQSAQCFGSARWSEKGKKSIKYIHVLQKTTQRRFTAVHKIVNVN